MTGKGNKTKQNKKKRQTDVKKISSFGFINDGKNASIIITSQVMAPFFMFQYFVNRKGEAFLVSTCTAAVDSHYRHGEKKACAGGGGANIAFNVCTKLQ